MSASVMYFSVTPCAFATSRICCDQRDDARDRNVAFEIAAERRHDAAALDRNAGRLVHLDDGMLPGELLRGGAVLIADGKFLRCAELDGAGIAEPVRCLQRALKALFVEPQRRVGDARLRRDAAHHVVGVGHARHVLRIDEGHDLDAVEAGLRQRIDQRDLARGRDRAFLDLKAFARAFLGDVHGRRQVAHDWFPPTLTMPRFVSASISSGARPSSARISPVCSPMRGRLAAQARNRDRPSRSAGAAVLRACRSGMRCPACGRRH